MSPCEHALVRRLAADGGWLSRDTLTEGLTWGAAVVDDCLANLVVGKRVLFNARSREYRLEGTLWARRALRLMVRDGLQRAAVVGHSGGQPAGRGTTTPRKVHVGMAMQTVMADGSPQVVMAELDMDTPPDLAGMLSLSTIVNGWVQ